MGGYALALPPGGRFRVSSGPGFGKPVGWRVAFEPFLQKNTGITCLRFALRPAASPEIWPGLGPPWKEMHTAHLLSAWRPPDLFIGGTQKHHVVIALESGEAT